MYDFWLIYIDDHEVTTEEYLSDIFYRWLYVRGKVEFLQNKYTLTVI